MYFETCQKTEYLSLFCSDQRKHVAHSRYLYNKYRYSWNGSPRTMPDHV